MPLPSRRLDLLLVPEDPLFVIPAQRWTDLVERGLVSSQGRSVGAAGLPRFVRARLDLPVAPMLYANQQGGFRVRCPRDGHSLVRSLSGAMACWRSGGAPELVCDCGETHSLTALEYLPPAAPGVSALVFADVDAYLLEEPALGSLREILGPFRLIPRRVS